MKYSRQTIKAFREYLNKQYGFSGDSHGERKYHARKRPYGDYLYHQDRDLFMASLAECIERGEFKENRKKD